MKAIRYTLLIFLACLTLGSCQDVEEPMNTVPAVTTDAVEKYSGEYAYLSGNVTSRSECYFLISTTKEMGEEAQKVETYARYNEERGKWFCQSEIGNLEPGTTYYVVLCATDGRSEVRGNVVEFTTASYLSLESVTGNGQLHYTNIGIYLTDSDSKILSDDLGNVMVKSNDLGKYTFPYNIQIVKPTFVYAYSPYGQQNSYRNLKEIDVWTDGNDDLLYGNCEVTSDNPKANIDMKSALATLEFAISTDNQESITIDYINLRNTNKSVENEALSIQGKLDLTTGIITPTPIQGHDGILMKVADNTIHAGMYTKARMKVIPTSFSDGEIILNVRLSGGQFVQVPIPAAKWEGGRSYEIAIKVNTKTDDGKARIGDYFYSDGTWSATYNANKECIGIVFALCDKAYGDINPQLTSSEHGRIVALKDAGTAQWHSSYTNVKDNPDVRYIDGKNHWGYLPIDGKSTYSTASNGKNIPLIEFNFYDWPTTIGDNYALTDYNGDLYSHNAWEDNSAIAVAYSYKAGKKTWFLPSSGEIARLGMAYAAGYISPYKQTCFNDFEHESYWSSCERDAESAWTYNFEVAFIGGSDKRSTYFIRPIASF